MPTYLDRRNKGNMNKEKCLNEITSTSMSEYVSKADFDRVLNSAVSSHMKRLEAKLTKNSRESACLLSSNVTVKVAGKLIGAIQKFNYTEGVDANGKVLIYGHCVRIFFDKTSILEAFTGLSVIDPNKKIDIELNYLDKTIILKNTNVNSHFITFDVKSCIVEENIGFNSENIVVVKTV